MRYLRRFVRRERGVSYTLPFVLIVPFYLMFMLLACETTFLALAKLGTQYAAHAAARSAVVWQSAEPEKLREQMPRQAARAALAALVAGRQHEINVAGPPDTTAYTEAADFASAVNTYTPGAAPADFLQRKYLNAAARTAVTITAADESPHARLTVTVTFRAPLYLPVVSRFLDPDGQAPYEYPLSATVILPNAAPVSDDGTLGIDYRSALHAGGR
jgi:Flp pilus assembly protein TadG